MFDKFPINLRNLRKSRSMSQEYLAELLGYSSKNVSKWENGQSFPDIQTLKNICEIFEIETINTLYETLIPFSFLNHDYDIKIIDKYKLSFDEYDLAVFYKMQENYKGLLFDVDSYNNVFNSLTKFKDYGIIEEFKILITEDNLFVEYRGIEHIKNKSLADVILDIEINKINLSNDIEYTNYVESLNLSKQCLIVLDFIDNNLSFKFSISDLYADKLVNYLKSLYPQNKDVKKVIRASVSKLAEANIIIKEGYSRYKKMHHKLNDDCIVNDNIMNYFNKIFYIDIKNDYDLKKSKHNFLEFDQLCLEKSDLLMSIVNYFLYLRNISVINSFKIYTNFSDNDFILNNEFIAVEKNGESEIMIEYM